MGGRQFSGGQFSWGNFPVGNFLGRIFPGGNFPGGVFAGGIFLEPISRVTVKFAAKKQAFYFCNRLLVFVYKAEHLFFLISGKDFREFNYLYKHTKKTARISQNSIFTNFKTKKHFILSRQIC